MSTIEFNSEVLSLSKPLRYFALNLTSNDEEAKDLLQETMLKAISNRHRFADKTNLKAWMYTIMKNTFITNYQKLVKRKTFIDTTENLHYLNSSQYTTKNEGEMKFTMEDINKALSKVDKAFTEPFMMYFHGYKYHEIADKLAIPIGTVKNRIHLARKELKSFLRMYN